MGLLDRWTKKEEKKVRTSKQAQVKKEKVKDDVVEAEVKTERAEQKAGLLAEKIIVKPLVTEKTAVMESLNKYGFIVTRKATKDQVKRAVDELYGVKPVRVNMANIEGKNVRFGRHGGRRSDYKKALVTLPAGKTITIHEGV